ncbi:MAG: flagellar biosynthetic protein FliR [Bryobacterales bacterium]|nr:flagellar biosynthetic protein FliR [Bryobacterales bacterium]MBV9400127.1 flagellar biosynthetic protein FliR [Bryobacterales bacterium]
MTIEFSTGILYAFLLVLARVAGLIAFLPIPGFRAAPDTVRIVLALAITLALFPVWPVLPNTFPSIGQLAMWAFSEAGLGLLAGLAVSFLTEGFQIAAQVAGLHAGYGYASTIDPNSEADSTVLQVMASLSTALLFFTTGLDHELIRVLAASFARFPAGTWAPAAAGLDGVIRLGSAMLSTGLRLAFPILALLLLIDLALALVGRVQQQLQLLSVAFPGKMAVALAMMAALAPAAPKVFTAESQRMLAALWRALS